MKFIDTSMVAFEFGGPSLLFWSSATALCVAALAWTILHFKFCYRISMSASIVSIVLMILIVRISLAATNLLRVSIVDFESLQTQIQLTGDQLFVICWVIFLLSVLIWGAIMFFVDDSLRKQPRPEPFETIALSVMMMVLVVCFLVVTMGLCGLVLFMLFMLLIWKFPVFERMV